MNTILALLLMALGLFVIVFSIRISRIDKYEYQHNHRVSSNLRSVATGKMNEKFTRSKDEISRGFTVDIRSGELIPCSQLSKESLS